MIVDFYNIFYYSSLFISVLIGLFYLKKVEIQFSWLAILMLVTLASELIAKYIAFGLDLSNYVVYHFFTPIEYTIYIIIYQSFLTHHSWKRLLWISTVGFILFEIINTVFFQSLQEMNTNTINLENILLVILSLGLFLKIRETPSQDNLLNQGVFWFNSAVLCYYAYNILFWGFHNMKVYLIENPPQFMYDFNKILSGLLYLTYSVAILLNASAKPSTLRTHG